MANKETEQLKKELAATPPVKEPEKSQAMDEPLDADAELRRIAEKDPIMRALLARMDVMSAQLKVAMNAPPPKAPTEVKQNGLIAEIPESDPPLPGTKRHKFQVNLAHARSAILYLDIVPGMEITMRDQAVTKYNKYFGILNSVHVHEVMEIFDGQVEE